MSKNQDNLKKLQKAVSAEDFAKIFKSIERDKELMPPPDEYAADKYAAFKKEKGFESSSPGGPQP